MKAAAAACMLVATVLAGCAASEETVTSETTGRPTLSAGKGAIAGLLIDDIYRPIPDALVLLQGTGLTATTDASGQFTLLDIQPGSYILVASATGHDAAPVNVDIVAGQYAEVEVSARRIFSQGGHVITTQYSIFTACATSAVLISVVYSCLLDSDSYRPGLQRLNFNESKELTYLVAEVKVNQADNYLFVLRHDDGSSFGGEQYGAGRINNTDYGRVILQRDSTYDNSTSRNVKWTNSKPMAALLFYLGQGGQELQDASCTAGQCGNYYGAGQRFALKGNIILSAFIGEPTVDIATYCVLSDCS
jgi:hypothetical protein